MRARSSKIHSALMSSEGLLTLEEAAKYLGVAKITLRRWTLNGHMACVRIGSRRDRRFRRKDLDAYIERRFADRADKKKPRRRR